MTRRPKLLVLGNCIEYDMLLLSVLKTVLHWHVYLACAYRWKHCHVSIHSVLSKSSLKWQLDLVKWTASTYQRVIAFTLCLFFLWQLFLLVTLTFLSCFLGPLFFFFSRKNNKHLRLIWSCHLKWNPRLSLVSLFLKLLLCVLQIILQKSVILLEQTNR